MTSFLKCTFGPTFDPDVVKAGGCERIGAFSEFLRYVRRAEFLPVYNAHIFDVRIRADRLRLVFLTCSRCLCLCTYKVCTRICIGKGCACK